MSTASPIDDLRDETRRFRGEDHAGGGDHGDLLRAIDRVLAADISISWMDGDVRRTHVDRAFYMEERRSSPPFMECAACSEPGSPTLCIACQHNRGVIERLTRQPDPEVDPDAKWAHLLAFVKSMQLGRQPEDVSAAQPPAPNEARLRELGVLLKRVEMLDAPDEGLAGVVTEILWMIRDGRV